MGPNNFENRYNPETKEPTEIQNLSLKELQIYKERYLDKSIARNQIDEWEFDDIYSENEIAKDSMVVKSAKEHYALALHAESDPEKKETLQKLQILAKLFEVMCSDYSFLSRAFNVPKGEIVAQMASDFDDIQNKTDVIMEFPRYKTLNAKPIDFSLAVDVTISKRSYGFKLNEFRNTLFDQKKIPEVKYFNESRYNHPKHRTLFKGAHELPKLIINLEPHSLIEVKDIWKEWLDKKNSLQSETEKLSFLRQKGLIDNPMWIQIIFQLRAQSNIISKRLDGVNNDLGKVYEQLGKVLSKIEISILDGFVQRDKGLQMKVLDISKESDPVTKLQRFNGLRANKFQELVGRRSKELFTIMNKAL